jgi:hypothetical protein
MTVEEAKTYAPVLERMVEILGKKNRLTLGEALAIASNELRIVIPRDMEGPLQSAAFGIISTGKMPGAPDA